MRNNYIIILSISTFVFIFAYSKSVYKTLKLQKELTKLLIAKVVLEEYITNIESSSIEKDESVHKENFIKFLSESRDWAYKYIEDVQNGLGAFIKAVDQDISHFDEFGDVLSTTRPDYESLKRISKAYKELLKLMPEEEK